MISSACSEADFVAIVKRAVKQAKKGDAMARKWISDYLVGKPMERHDVSIRSVSLPEALDLCSEE